MRAVRLRAPASLDNLTLADLADPGDPGTGEIRVRLAASSLNFHDFAVVAGMIPTVDGRIPMSDGAGEVIALSCDVADEARIAAALEQTLGAFGRVDACFANAGISGAGTAIPDITAEGWDHTMVVNTRGAALVYKHVSRHMIARAKEGEPGGKLIATSSGQSIMGVNRSSDYAASKAALNGLTRAAAFELARYQITANALLFGYYETDITAKADPRFAEWMSRRIPLRRPGDHDGLEGLAVFLASPHSDYITGQCLPVDGGLCIS